MRFKEFLALLEDIQPPINQMQMQNDPVNKMQIKQVLQTVAKMPGTKNPGIIKKAIGVVNATGATSADAAVDAAKTQAKLSQSE